MPPTERQLIRWLVLYLEDVMQDLDCLYQVAITDPDFREKLRTAQSDTFRFESVCDRFDQIEAVVESYLEGRDDGDVLELLQKMKKPVQ